MMNETFQSIAEEVKALVEEKLGSAREDIQEQINKALLLESQIEELEKSINEAQLDSSIGLTSIRVVSDELAKRIEELEAIEIYHGQDGVDGKDGIDGKDGADGAVGPAGADGSDGRDGVDGLGADTPIWAEGVYREGSIVQANYGQFFRAVKDTSSDVNSDDWERVGTAGFRMTGAFDNDRQYQLGDLFIKDFGLFLSDGEQHKLIVGRGPQGKKGERGLPGKDGIGVDGKDGKDGRDGDTFDCIELSGTNLIVVMKDADDQLVTKTVDLSPVLDVAAEVTKSIETKTQKQFVEVWNEQAKNFSQRLQEHLLDQEAIPVAFYRGLWTAGQSYVRGDLVTFGGALYVSRVTTESTPKSVFEVGGDWVQVSAAAGAGGSGGSGGGDGTGGPILTSQVLLTHPQRYNYKTQEDANKGFAEALEKLEVITTQQVQTSPEVMFRDAKGRFKATPEELEQLTNQMEVNRWILQALEKVEGGDIDLSAVEDRLDDIEEVLPRTPLVIDPVDLGRINTLVDYPSRPSGAEKPPEGQCWMWHMDAGRVASGNTPGNEMKVTVPYEVQGNIIFDGIKEVWFKQGERVQKWNVQNGGWWTGGNLWHMSAQSTEGDDLVAGESYEVYYTDPNTVGDEFVDVISRNESKADDRRLQAEIEEIALILGTIANAVENGYYTYVGDSIPSQAGQFSLAFPNVTTAENIVTFNEVDANGTTHNLPSTVSVDDYLEVVDMQHPDQFALWQVTEVPDGTGIFSVRVKLVKAGQTFDVDDRCEARFFSVTDALDVNELDARYLRLTGGTLTGKLNLHSTLEFGRDHPVLMRINPEGGTTQEIDLFEGNSGGQILRFDLQGATFKNAIEFESGPSNNKDTILRLDSNNGIRVHGLSADDTRIVKVGDPTEDTDAANKQYVDSTVKAEVDGNFVSKTGGDEMEGPFKIIQNGVDSSRDARRLEVLDIKSGSENSSLNLGAKNTSVYIGDSQTTFVKPILVDDIGEKNEGHNVNFLNTTTAPRVEVKTGERVSEAVLLIEGHRTGTNNPSARLTMSNNENDNAYGSLSWKGTDGNGWFEFTNKVKLAQEGTDDDHVVTKKYVDDTVQSGIDGIDFPETDLTGYATEEWVTGQIEAIDIPDPDLSGYATTLYVDQKVSQVSFTPGQQVAKTGSSSNNIGSFWIVDGALYCKVS